MNSTERFMLPAAMIFRSRLPFAHALSLSLLVLAGACAAEPPPPPEPPPVAPRPPPPPPPDVTAVPPPSNLVLYARLSNTAGSLKVAMDWARLPTIEPSTLVLGLLEGVTSSKDYAVFATIVDASQPVDFAASFEVKLPPKGYGALSAAVKDIDAAKSLLAKSFDLTPGTNGVVALTLRSDQGKEKSEKSEDDDKGACEIAPAAGAAPFRLVCASSRDALGALGPYLTRTTPRQSIPSDMHLELHAGPVGGLASLGRLQAASLLTSLMGLNAGTEPATAELVSAGIGDTFDYLADLDTQTMDVTLDPAHGGLTYRTTFKSQTSLVARLSTAHPEKVDVAPDAFWQLPADVDLASFANGMDEADLKHPRDLLVAAADEQLKKKKLLDGDRQALTAVLAHTLRSSRGVMGHGMVDHASYWIWEQDLPPASTEKNARELVATWNRPGVAKWLRSADESGSPLPTVRLGGPIAGLPRGALHVIVSVPADVSSKIEASAKGAKEGKSAAKPRPPLVAAATTTPKATAPKGPPVPPDVFHVVVVPDGARSWTAVSTSEAALVKALTTVVAKNGDTLGAHAADRGLAGFKESRVSGGSFATVASFIEIVRGFMTGKHEAEGVKWDRLLAHLPAKGMTPMILKSTSRGGTPDDPGGTSEVEMTVPADAIRDAIWFGFQL